MSNLMKRAAVELQKSADRAKALRARTKAETQSIVSGASVLAGAAAAAVIDARSDATRAEVGGFPVAALLGAAAVAAPMVARIPGGVYLQHAGLGAIAPYIHQYIYGRAEEYFSRE